MPPSQRPFMGATPYADQSGTGVTFQVHVNNAGKVIAFHRWDQGGNGDDVVVMLNFANRSYASYRIGFPRGGSWRVRFNSDWSGYDAAFGSWPSFDTNTDGGPQDSMPVSGSVGLGPYSAVILSQD